MGDLKTDRETGEPSVINFIHGSPANSVSLMRAAGVGHLTGVMVSPASGNDPRRAVEAGLPWVIDNDCFTGYRPDRISATLQRHAGVPGCVFAVVPDVVSDHVATLALWHEWIAAYRDLGYPPAFVAQDGCTATAVPHDAAAVFIGGSDRYKHSDTVRSIVKEAKRRNLWVHMGRVNTLQRIRYASAIGCDSIDGLRWARFRDCFHFAPALAQRQGYLWD